MIFPILLILAAIFASILGVVAYVEWRDRRAWEKGKAEERKFYSEMGLSPEQRAFCESRRIVFEKSEIMVDETGRWETFLIAWFRKGGEMQAASEKVGEDWGPGCRALVDRVMREMEAS